MLIAVQQASRRGMMNWTEKKDGWKSTCSCSKHDEGTHSVFSVQCCACPLSHWSAPGRLAEKLLWTAISGTAHSAHFRLTGQWWPLNMEAADNWTDRQELEREKKWTASNCSDASSMPMQICWQKGRKKKKYSLRWNNARIFKKGLCSQSS